MVWKRKNCKTRTLFRDKKINKGKPREIPLKD